MMNLVPGMTSQFGFSVGDRVQRIGDTPFYTVKDGMRGNVVGFATSANAPGGYLVYVKFDEAAEAYGCYFDNLVKVPVVLADNKMEPGAAGDLFVGMDPAAEDDEDRAPDGTCTSCYGYPECAVNCEAAARRKKPAITATETQF